MNTILKEVFKVVAKKWNLFLEKEDSSGMQDGIEVIKKLNELAEKQELGDFFETIDGVAFIQALEEEIFKQTEETDLLELTSKLEKIISFYKKKLNKSLEQLEKEILHEIIDLYLYPNNTKKVLDEPYDLEEIKRQYEATEWVEGYVKVDHEELVNATWGEFFDTLANKLVDSPLLMQINYKAAGVTKDNQIIFKVNGDPSEVISSKED